MPDVDPGRLVIQTPRLLLRLMREDDRIAFKHFHEINVAHFRQWNASADQSAGADDAFDDLLTRTQANVRDDMGYRFFGIAADGRIAGVFGLSEIVRRAFQNAYAGWRVSCEFTQQGIGTEGVNALLDLAFAPAPAGLGLHRAQANIQPSNLPSIALARKTGFREEGYAPRYLHINGEWRDHLMFAKTAEEHRPVYLLPQR